MKDEVKVISFKEGQTELIEDLLPYARQLYGKTEKLECVNDFIRWAVEISCYEIIEHFGEHVREEDGSVSIYWSPDSKE